ncbi:UDP-N-acetylmuramoyl-tripeptide--D-alanyl-D-alanine ligase [Salegentibacter chungangensis]|uniref:UDP-N-acetylmuramoyl-tripeptide--D-alanyl-D-alanine ligase n=1 Tax=Salegentibacter chungangensis TaxID=1335724 RepID=A0ABW3NY99_9FLAO
MNTAQLHQKFLLTSGAGTDTRNIQEGSMFFALKGANFNGNKYAAEALQKGAKLAVVDDPDYALNKEQYILVKNVLQSLQALATFHRKFLGIPIIGITGSNGKTTTKELTQAVLSRKYNTVATSGNLNNHIGVPLTLLSMNENTEIGIVEMGANHPGEIEFLCNITCPDYGYITNFGKAHLEGFGSLEGVIKAKSELYNHLKDHKKLIFLNYDDEVQKKHSRYNHVFSFGRSRNAHVKIEFPGETASATLEFNNTRFTSKLTGRYNALNMAAALSIGLYFKVLFSDIKEAIENYTPSNNRSQLIEMGSNTILMDAYNANPTSMMAALENFRDTDTKKTKIVILGDMLEVGDSSEVEHQAIVNFITNNDFSETYLVGPNFKKTHFNKSTVIKFNDTSSLKKHLKLSKTENSFILIKGSRGMALENLLDAL